MKTVKAAKKRFKIGARGRVKASRAGKQHINSGMSSERRRKKRGMKPMECSHDAKDIKRCLLKEGK
jgi:ribosomal protein L35